MDGPPAGPAWGGAILAKLRAEMSCGVCGELMADPHVVPICGHAFCRDCIHGVLEGPGITQSRCPTCRQPVWKRELLRNHKYASMIELLATDLGLRWDEAALQIWAVGLLSGTNLSDLLRSTELRLHARAVGGVAVSLAGADTQAPSPDIPPTEPMELDQSLASASQLQRLTAAPGGGGAGAAAAVLEARGMEEEEIPDSQEGEGWLSLSDGARGAWPAGPQPVPFSSPRPAEPGARGGQAQPSKPQGEELIGRRCEVWWPGELCFYGGVITACREGGSPAPHATPYLYDIQYDDGDVDNDIALLDYREVFQDGESIIQVLRSSEAEEGSVGDDGGGEAEGERAKVVLAASGVRAEAQRTMESLAARMSDCRVEDAVSMATTHLVVGTDAQGLALQRSTKYLTAMARGLWIVTDRWVTDSAAAGGWEPEAPYEVAGDKHARGGPQRARLRVARGEAPLLAGIPCLLDSDGYSLTLDPAALKRIALLAGATMVERCGRHFVPEGSALADTGADGRPPADAIAGTVRVLVCGAQLGAVAGDSVQASPALRWADSGAVCVHFNWVIDSLSEGALLPNTPYLLSP
eukprot:jgi/Tetstr1/435428/TSEL_024335.t1